MSAANASAPAPSIDDQARAQEPSMEEILASIRRIIADDDALPSARRRMRDASDRGLAADQPAAPSPNAHLEPAFERHDPLSEDPAQSALEQDFAEEESSEPPPVAEITPLRPTRPDEDSASQYEAAGLTRPDFAPPQAPDEASRLSVPSGTGDPLQSIDTDAPLVSSDAASSIAAHFQTLAASMVINESGLLQKYAQEMLRPMLKQWLDDNLPVIVERLVRAEIERVARGGRR